MLRSIPLVTAAFLALAAGVSSAASGTSAGVVGKPVVDKSGNRIGEVKDKLPDSDDGAATHLVVDFEPGWHDGDGWLAVPVESFTRDGNAFLARFDADDIRPASAAPAAPAQPTAPPAPSMEGRDARLSKLARAPVRDSRGERLGDVTDLVVDMTTKRIAFAVIAPGPALLAYACAVGEGGLSIDTQGFLLPAEAAGLASVSACAPPRALQPGELSAGSLLRTSLVDVRGNVVGSFAEVVVRAHDASLHYAVGDFGPGWLREGLLAALPLRPLREADGELRMVAYMEDLHRMPVFEERRLADVWSPAFARGVEKYLAAR